MSRILVLFVSACTSALLVASLLLGLASIFYSEGRRHTSDTLTRLDGAKYDDRRSLSIRVSPNKQSNIPTDPACELRPNRYGEPFIRCT